MRARPAPTLTRADALPPLRRAPSLPQAPPDEAEEEGHKEFAKLEQHLSN